MDRPKLRGVQRLPLTRGEEELIVLRDPLDVAEPFALDAAFAPVLDLLDGQHTVVQIRQSLRFRDVVVEAYDLDTFVHDLDVSGWLDGDTFRDRWQQVAAAFLAAPVRPTAHAGVLYPERQDDLCRLLTDVCPPAQSFTAEVVGLVCPYQPFDAAADIYASVLRSLPDPTAIDCVVVLATDHGPGLLPYALTAKDHATPLGHVAVDHRRCSALAQRVPWLMREEIRHRRAHSTELAAILLAYAYGSACPPVVPILCGRAAWPLDAVEETEQFLEAAEYIFARDRVLWLAMAELSHVGPAYGQPKAAASELGCIDDEDRSLLDALRGPVAPQRTTRLLGTRSEHAQLSGSATLATLVHLLPLGACGDALGYQQLRVPGSTPGWAGIGAVAFRSA